MLNNRCSINHLSSYEKSYFLLVHANSGLTRDGLQKKKVLELWAINGNWTRKADRDVDRFFNMGAVYLRLEAIEIEKLPFLVFENCSHQELYVWSQIATEIYSSANHRFIWKMKTIVIDFWNGANPCFFSQKRTVRSRSRKTFHCLYEWISGFLKFS